MRVEIELSNRTRDIVQEGYDLAVRLGRLADSRLVATRLAPRVLHLCATPAYLESHGSPAGLGLCQLPAYYAQGHLARVRLLVEHLKQGLAALPIYVRQAARQANQPPKKFDPDLHDRPGSKGRPMF